MKIEPIDSAPPRVVAACPWCGPGTQLVAKFDGFGTTALSCNTCGCRGPIAQISEEFASAESKAVDLWSTRSSTSSAVPGSLFDRMRISASLARAVTQCDDANSFAEVRISDLQQLLAAVARAGE